jgi:predicted nucleotidyltransferase
MNKVIDIAPAHLNIVREILQKYLPPTSTVWVFGSRATGTAKKFSDLDLLIDIGKPLPLEISADLSNDFEESDLPYKVDIVDWITISASFRERISLDRIVIYPVDSQRA